jgi:hypothetical protein
MARSRLTICRAIASPDDAKNEVRIFDYVDAGHPILARMFERRIKGYEALGYKPPSPENFLL